MPSSFLVGSDADDVLRPANRGNVADFAYANGGSDVIHLGHGDDVVYADQPDQVAVTIYEGRGGGDLYVGHHVQAKLYLGRDDSEDTVWVGSASQYEGSEDAVWEVRQFGQEDCFDFSFANADAIVEDFLERGDDLGLLIDMGTNDDGGDAGTLTIWIHDGADLDPHDILDDVLIQS